MTDLVDRVAHAITSTKAKGLGKDEWARRAAIKAINEVIRHYNVNGNRLQAAKARGERRRNEELP